MYLKNESKYEAIYKENKDKGTPLSQLCEKQGVTYQAFRNWVKGHKEGSKTAPKKQPHFRREQDEVVNITLPLSDVIAAWEQGNQNLILPLRKVFDHIPEQQRNRIYASVGRAAVEAKLRRVSEKSDEPVGSGLTTKTPKERFDAHQD